jgi:hypothetical protein
VSVGKGHYAIKRVELDDTDISHFHDVETHVVEPGGTLELVQAAVVTAPEVSGLELLGAKFVGPYTACGAGHVVAKVGIDIVCNGLGVQTGDGIDAKTVSIRADVREVDDFGVALGAWQTVISESITAATTDQVRRSFYADVMPPRRLEVRVARTDLKDESLGVLNSVQWAQLRAYLGSPVAAAAEIHLVDRGDQLSEWTISASEGDGFNRGYVIQDGTRGNPAPSYCLIFDENDPAPAAWAFRDFGIGGATSATIKLDVVFDYDSVTFTAGDRPARQAQVTVRASVSGVGARVMVTDATEGYATLAIGNAASWSANTPALASFVIPGGLANDTVYSLEISIERNADSTSTVTAVLKSGATTLGTVTHSALFAFGGYIGFTGISGADEQGAIGLQTYYDNIDITASVESYLLQAPLDPNSTYLEVKMRASEQLNGLTQRRIAVLSNRKVPTWHPDTGWSDELVETRSIAWAVADVLHNADYGRGLPDSRIDLQTLYELDQVWAARQDRFDHVFDGTITVHQALQLIARAGRAVPILRTAGVYTVMRDQQQTLPVAMYTPRNMVKGSFAVDYVLPTSETPNGVILKYFSNRTWDWETIECPVPGYSVTDPDDPRFDPALPPMNRADEVELPGVSGAKQAEREGLYIAADHYYRRKYPRWTSELDGLLPAYGSMVLAAHDVVDWGQSGDVADWNAGSLTMTLSEPPVWGSGRHYLQLHDPKGRPLEAIEVEPGPALDQVVLASAPSSAPQYLDGGMDRTRYVFGAAAEQAMPVRVRSITPRGLTRVEITAVAEDDRVHQRDNHLLPGASEVQDPIDADYDYEDPTGGSVLVVSLDDHTVFSSGGTTSNAASLTLQNNGVLNTTLTVDGVVTSSSNENDEWLNVKPATADQCGGFEVRAVPIAGAVAAGAMNTWLALSTSRSWSVAGGGFDAGYAEFRLEIRDAVTLLLQEVATVRLGADPTIRDGF